jgi:hypothetical protein
MYFNKKIIFVCSAILILLLGMLSFPMGYDQSIFQIGGELIARKGAIPYRDFIELKQPLIFYIYSLAIVLFGEKEISIRILDFIYQLITLWFFYRLLQGVYKDRLISCLCVILYTVFYVSGGHWMTAQTESFAVLPLILLAGAMFKFEENPLRSNLTVLSLKFAVIFLILLLLKITLVFAFGGTLGYLLFSSNKSREIQRGLFFQTTFFSLLFASLTLLVFYLNGSLQNFLLGLDWLNHYAGTVRAFDIETYRSIYFHLFPSTFISVLSPLYFVFSIAGIVIIYFQKENISSKERIFHRILFWQIFFGLAGILYERKSFDYHFTRVIWMLIPFISIALFTYFQSFRNLLLIKGKEAVGTKLFIYISLAIICLLFSPIPRLISQPMSWTILSLSGDSNARMQKLTAGKMQNEETQWLRSFLTARMKPEDNLFFWGNYTHIYLETSKVPVTLCMTSNQFISPWTPIEWKTQLISELKTQNPKFFVSETNDARPLISGSKLDSYSSLLQWTELRSYLFTNYILQDSSEHFKIFLRKG